MCAIAGILSLQEEKNRLVALRDLMTHRGPDEGTAFFNSQPQTGTHLAFGHRRLAIRDLSPQGRQPMTDASGRFTLIYNGEIYNHLELKEKLRAEGITDFRSTGDTEILLNAWTVWGEETPQMLQGEFAFAIWDHRELTLWLCRDRLGIKPLYYSQKKGEIAFASELSALFQTGFVGQSLNRQALDGYLAFGSVPEPLTIYEDGKILEAGTLLRIQARDFSSVARRFWENPFAKSTSLAARADLPSVGKLLTDSVLCRLVADAPLSLFLSGGIDSSSIAAAAMEGAEEPLHTLCAFSSDAQSIDRMEAKRVALHLKTSHSEVALSGSDFLTMVEDAVSALDQPSMDAVNTFAVARAAHLQGFKVALSGVGADELFCGYTHIQRAKHFSLLQRIPSFLAPPLIARRSNDKLSAFFRSPRQIEDFYGSSRALFLDPTRKALLVDHPTLPIGQWVRNLVPWIGKVQDPVNALSALDIEIYLKNVLLRDADAMGMANSLEIRGPFLDHRLVDLVASLRGSAKISSSGNKPLITRTIGKNLPAHSLALKKRGFTFPWNELLDGPLRSKVRATFSSDYGGVWYQLGLDLSTAEKLYLDFTKKQSGVIWSQIWALYSLVHWLMAQRARASESNPLKSFA